MGEIDRTWQWGPLYLDVCGCVVNKVVLGILVSWSNLRHDSYGRGISLHLVWWCVTLGWECRGEA